MAKTTLKTASVLAFERKLSNSDAQMYSGDWGSVGNNNGWSPIIVNEKAVRGTISNRQKNAIQSVIQLCYNIMLQPCKGFYTFHFPAQTGRAPCMK